MPGAEMRSEDGDCSHAVILLKKKDLWEPAHFDWRAYCPKNEFDLFRRHFLSRKEGTIRHIHGGTLLANYG